MLLNYLIALPVGTTPHPSHGLYTFWFWTILLFLHVTAVAPPSTGKTVLGPFYRNACFESACASKKK